MVVVSLRNMPFQLPRDDSVVDVSDGRSLWEHDGLETLRKGSYMLYICMYVYVSLISDLMNTTGPWSEHDPRSPGPESWTTRRSASDSTRVNLT